MLFLLLLLENAGNTGFRFNDGSWLKKRPFECVHEN